MIPGNRGISTVFDVALAVLLIGASLVLLVGFVESGPPTHEPVETEQTTETLLSSTVNTTYSVWPLLAKAHNVSDEGSVYETTAYDSAALRRVSHGPIAAQLADTAVMNLSLQGDRLPTAAPVFRARLNETVQARLVASSFETHVTAIWQPFEGGESQIRGTADIGTVPPPGEDVSATTVTVPCDVPAVRETAITAVDRPDQFGVVARIVATAIVEGYVPAVESQRALESSGVARDIVAFRYRNLASALDPAEPVGPHLARESANATRANQLLIQALTVRLQSVLEPRPAQPPAEQPLGNATAAAAQITTGEVTVTVRTWD